MNYIVGYPVQPNPEFMKEIVQKKNAISEVYFSWGDMPNGRSALFVGEELSAFEIQMQQYEDLKCLSTAGLRFNLLFNANCYGKDSQSRAFFQKIGDLTDMLREEIGLSSVTTASPLIAKFIKENFVREDKTNGTSDAGNRTLLSFL